MASRIDVMDVILLAISSHKIQDYERCPQGPLLPPPPTTWHTVLRTLFASHVQSSTR